MKPRVVTASTVLVFMACLVIGAATSEAPASEERTRLEKGIPVEREVPIGRADVFEIDISGRQYVAISAERPFGDIRLRLLQPGGEAIEDLLGKPEKGSSLWLVSIVDQPGLHRLEVRCSDAGTEKPGLYRIALEDQRAAGPTDRDRADAFHLLAEARRSRAAPLTEISSREAKAAILHDLEGLVSRFRFLRDPLGEALALDALFEALYGVGEPDRLRETADAALAAWRAAGRRREEGLALGRVGLAAYVAYDKTRVLEAYQAALAIHLEVGDLGAASDTLQRIGWYHRWTGDRKKAIEYYRRALPLRARNRDWPGEITTISDIALASLELGEVEVARDHLEQALERSSPERDVERIPTLLYRLGMVQAQTGEHAEAVATLRRAVEAAARTGDKRAEASALNQLAVVYDKLGGFVQEKTCLERSLALTREMRMRNGEAWNLSALSRAYRSLGDLETATTHAREALELSRASQDAAAETAALTSLAALALDRDDEVEARGHLQEALDLSRSLGLRRQEASQLMLLARGQAGRGELDESLRLARRSLEIHRGVLDREYESATLASIAQWELEQGRRGVALEHIQAAVDITESLRRKLPQRDWTASYLASAQGKYALLIDVLMFGGEPDVARAFEVSERARARSLLDMLAESRIDVREDVDPELLAQETSLRRRLEFVASEQNRVLDGKPTSEDAASVAKRIDEITIQLRELEAQIRSSSPRYAALVHPEPLSAARIQGQVLDQDSILLEVALGRERSWLFAVTPSSLAGYPLPPSSVIEGLARSVTDAMTARLPRRDESASRRRERVQEADRLLGERSLELSQMILGPAAADMKEQWRGKRLVIVAPGALEYLPFAALPEPLGAEDSPPGRPALIAGHEIVSLPSASVLEWMRRDPADGARGEATLAVFADPVFGPADPRVARAKTASRSDGSPVSAGFGRLPFSREEAQSIASMVPRESLLLAMDFEASRSRVLAGELAGYRIVHFATHGVLDAEHPELSGLVLSTVDSRGNGQDGFLRLTDIYHLDLPADLVVLSACRTALGRQIRGEGLVGVTRGFMYAGARRVVASLWRVDDQATAELMHRFYRGMFQDDLTPAAALRAAQIDLSKQERSAAPYYWAGFVLQGEWR